MEKPLPVQKLARIDRWRRLRLEHVVARAGGAVPPEKRALLAVRKSNAGRGSPSRALSREYVRPPLTEWLDTN